MTILIVKDTQCNSTSIVTVIVRVIVMVCVIENSSKSIAIIKVTRIVVIPVVGAVVVADRNMQGA